MKKPNGDWQICIDFTNLNKAYSKNSLSFPRINQLVDATMRHEFVSFMDEYSSYN